MILQMRAFISQLLLLAFALEASVVAKHLRGYYYLQHANPDLSPEQLNAQAAMLKGEKTKKDVEIVMAHFNEDASWARRYQDFVTIYTHGSPGQEANLPGAQMRVLSANVGKESHVYLTHIVRNYDDLADWTVFTQAGEPSNGYAGSQQGGGGDHDGGHLVAGSIFDDYVLAYASDLPHYFVESSAVETASLDHKLRLDFTTDQDVRPGKRGTWGLEDRCLPADSPLWMNSWIKMDKTKFEPLVSQREQCGTKCPSMIEFMQQLGVPGNFSQGQSIVFAQGARFAVSRRRLLRHPRSYYEALLDQVSGEADPWQGYYYEYLWFHLVAAADSGSRMCAEAPVHEDQALQSRRARESTEEQTNAASNVRRWVDGISGRRLEGISGRHLEGISGRHHKNFLHFK